jgi:sigma-B regulation protein RsbU (phosphoserine phosphatase)
MRILIAEDDQTTRSMLEAVLTRFGYTVEAVADGHAAWAAMARPEGPRLALLDWMMPGLDGETICRQVRALDSADPPYLILLTARTEKQDIVLGLRAGANDYIAKPYDVAELQARLAVGARLLELQAALARRMAEREELIVQLQTALAEVQTLSGIIPICANCKKVRDDRGYWNQVEAYIQSRSLAKFSHGICPDCSTQLYPEITAELRRAHLELSA